MSFFYFFTYFTRFLFTKTRDGDEQEEWRRFQIVFDHAEETDLLETEEQTLPESRGVFDLLNGSGLKVCSQIRRCTHSGRNVQLVA